MRILGIITEYNPYHLGHRLHLQEAKKLILPDLTICVMSSSFVQRGEPAMISYQKRAAIAIEEGIDIVIELPLVYACQSADYFAKGAVTLLHEMGVTDLVFGSEDGNIETFLEIAEGIEQDPDTYNMKVKEGMKDGLRYPDACNQALQFILNKEVRTPNDLLGLSYVKEVVHHHYPISMHCIKRTNDYHAKDIEQISSATSLRIALKQGIDVSHQLPGYETYKDSHFFTLEEFYPYLKYLITFTPLEGLHMIEEGLDDRLYKVNQETYSLEELINSLTSKRYTRSRIQRMLIHILLHNTKEEIKKAMDIDYIHILGLSTKGQRYIKTAKKNTEYKIITNITKHKHPALDIEKRGAQLLDLVNPGFFNETIKAIPYRKIDLK